MSHIPTVKLNNGVEMPALGLGTFKEQNDNILINAVKTAITAGYRHFDCAYIYNNEKHIGQAIREAIAESNGKLKRKDLFIVSKCWNTFHSKEKVEWALDQTLTNFGLDYLDLFLMHWPMGFEENKSDFPVDENGSAIPSDIHYTETYQALEECVKKGKTKSIGLSNFNVQQMQDILNIAKIKPVCNQFEVSPLFRNEEWVVFCQKNDIVVVAYAPFGGPDRPWGKPDDPYPLTHPNVLEVAKKHNKSAGQIILRWLYQRKIVGIPKSVTPKRIEENSQIFDFSLSEDDMKTISGIKEQFRFYVFEVTAKHKFYPF